MFLSTEEIVIGMVLNNADDLRKAVAAGISDACFTEPTNRVIWKAVSSNTLHALDVGYPARIEELKSVVPLTQNIEFYLGELILSSATLRVAADLSILSGRWLARRPFAPPESLLRDTAALLGEIAELSAKFAWIRSAENGGNSQELLR